MKIEFGPVCLGYMILYPENKNENDVLLDNFRKFPEIKLIEQVIYNTDSFFSPTSAYFYKFKIHAEKIQEFIEINKKMGSCITSPGVLDEFKITVFVNNYFNQINLPNEKT